MLYGSLSGGYKVINDNDKSGNLKDTLEGLINMVITGEPINNFSFADKNSDKSKGLSSGLGVNRKGLIHNNTVKKNMRQGKVIPMIKRRYHN